MKQRILITLLTVLVFGAGYFGGVWTERHSCKVPKPPKLLSELSNAKTASGSAATNAAPAPTAPNARELAAQIEQLRPQIDAFRARLEEIDREMDQEISSMLTPEQQKVFDGIVRYYADLRAKEDADLQRPGPLSSEEIEKLQQGPVYKMVSIVILPLRLEWNTRELNLTPPQTDQLRQILERRRDKFLRLIDSSPPPTLRLSKIAPAVQRLVPPAEVKK